MNPLTLPHRVFSPGRLWYLREEGVAFEGEEAVFRTPGEPLTMRRLWELHGVSFRVASRLAFVPAELLMATAATETKIPGRPECNAEAIRREKGWVSDEETPNRVSMGLMQLLISTAREVSGNALAGRAELMDPAWSIRVAAMYIRRQAARSGGHATFLDPVLVAAAYNAGGLYRQLSPENWTRLRQFPIGTAEHVNRFLAWYGDAVAVVDGDRAMSSERAAVTHRQLMIGIK